MKQLNKYKAHLLSKVYFPKDKVNYFAYAWLVGQLLLISILERGQQSNTITGMTILLKEMLIRFPVNGFVGASSAEPHPGDIIKGIVLSYGEMTFVKGVVDAERTRLWQELKRDFRAKGKGDEDDLVLRAYQLKMNEQPMTPEGYCFIILDRINRREYEIKRECEGDPK